MYSSIRILLVAAITAAAVPAGPTGSSPPSGGGVKDAATHTIETPSPPRDITTDSKEPRAGAKAASGAAKSGQSSAKDALNGAKENAAGAKESQAGAAASDTRLREGTTLTDESGEFRDLGDRVVFRCERRTTEFTVLENLTLERVTSALRENSDSRAWTVSGTVTEFRGSNYLLVTRAVLRSQSTYTPPAAKSSP